jgi:hypothetical protein
VQRANYRELPQIIEIARSVDVNTISFLAVDVSSVEAFGPRFERDPEVSMIASPGPGAPPEHGLPALALTPDEIDELAVILDEIEIRFAADFESGRIAESPAKLRRILLRYFHVLVNGGEFERPPCNAPHFSAVIEATGLLRPCYFLPGFGRLKSGTPLLETLNAPAAQALRHAYRHGDRRECAGCVCPLYKGVRSLVQL